MGATTKIEKLELAVSSVEIAGMQAAAAILREIRGAATGDTRGILAALTSGTLAAWRHYPEGDVYDPLTGAQYFFHAHPPAQRAPREYGHFHTFLRAEGMPAGVAPLVLPETAVANGLLVAPQAAPLKRGRREEVSHLVAVTVDANGEPVRLFTTNRWVTGETWYRADDVISMLGRFTVGNGEGPALINRWLTAVIALFQPQIAYLLRLRDEMVMGWRRRRRTNVFEDVRLEITSSCDIDIDLQLGFLDRLGDVGSPRSPVRSARLVRAADGWPAP